MDRNMIVDIIKAHPMELENYEAYQDDRELVLLAVKKNGLALQFASERLRSDKELVLQAMQEDCDILMCVPEELLAQKEMALSLVGADAYAYKYLADELKNDREIISAAMSSRNSPWAYAEPSADWQRDVEIIRLLTEHLHAGDEAEFVRFFDTHCLAEELLEDDAFIVRLADLFAYTQEELEIDKALALRMISLSVFDQDLYSDDLLEDPDIEEALSL